MDPLSVKPELIYELAMGVGDPAAVAKKHGYSELELMQMHTYPWFNKALSDRRDELEKSGFDFRAKMKMLAEDMIIDVYQAAKLSNAVSSKLDVAKHLTKIAGLEPAVGANPAAQGAGFSITINFNGGRETVTLEANKNAEDAQIIEGSRPDFSYVAFPVSAANRDLGEA